MRMWSVSFSLVAAVDEDEGKEDVRRSDVSSSPMIGSSGKAFYGTVMMTTCVGEDACRGG